MAGGLGFGPRLLVSQAALERHRLACNRAAGCAATIGCACRAACPCRSAACAATTKARTAMPRGRLGYLYRAANASPQLERNVERFTQFLTICRADRASGRRCRRRHAVNSHLDRRRETIATDEGAGRQRPTYIHDLSYAGTIAVAARWGDRRGHRCRSAICSFVDIWRNHSFADRARIAPCRTAVSTDLWTADRARLCTLAAGPRA